MISARRVYFCLTVSDPAHAGDRHVNEIVLSFRRIDDIGRMPEFRRILDEMKMASLQGGADQPDRKVARSAVLEDVL